MFFANQQANWFTTDWPNFIPQLISLILSHMDFFFAMLVRIWQFVMDQMATTLLICWEFSRAKNKHLVILEKQQNKS